MSEVSVVEIFSSIQGEGKYAGCRQVFVRMAGCNLACRYCDTPDSRNPVLQACIECNPGKRDFISANNPLSVEEVSGYINNLLVSPHHSVSFTGGEPLCQLDALKELVQHTHGKSYLETNGTMPDALKVLLPYIDIVSMDIKLPSVTGQEYWTEHEKFLQLAVEKDIFVKVVVTGDTHLSEFMRAMNLVAKVDPAILVVIQPVTPLHGVLGISPEKMLEFQAVALDLVRDARVIPQTHKFMGQL
ncbi:MAG: 7-carboxy-7-deazaguanine synthase-like [Firmicutes bacterium]|nr:7-carboxy-7-deazaguanine synthase-like [Bacillota bacterium]